MRGTVIHFQRSLRSETPDMFAQDIRLIALSEDRRGLAAVEYALICLMMSTMLIVMWPTVQTGLAAAFGKIVALINASHG